VPRRKELEAENLELRKRVESTAADLGRLAEELDYVFQEGRDPAVKLLAFRVRSLAGELSAELREEELDVEGVGWVVRLAKHWVTRAVAIGVVQHLSGVHVGPVVDNALGAAVDGLDSVLEMIAAVGSLPPTGTSFPRNIDGGSASDWSPTASASTGPPRTIDGGSAADFSETKPTLDDPAAHLPHDEHPESVEMAE
jgi:hypothetical protein